MYACETVILALCTLLSLVLTQEARRPERSCSSERLQLRIRLGEQIHGGLVAQVTTILETHRALRLGLVLFTLSKCQLQKTEAKGESLMALKRLRVKRTDIYG